MPAFVIQIHSMLLPQTFDHNNNQNWFNLKGLALPLAISEFHERHPGLLVVLTDSVHHSRVLESEIALCNDADDIKVLHFPIWDTLPYDVFPPNPDIVSERMKFLAEISTVKQTAVVITPLIVE